MEEIKVKVKVQGISNSQIQSGAFALVMSEEGLRRLPIIVGLFEAQSIALAFENVHPPRPLTHDLFISFVSVTGLRFKEVFIYKFDDGVFYSVIIVNDGTRDLQIDSRTSDAIAIAIRAKCPIFTTEAIMQKCAIVIDNSSHEDENDPEAFPAELTAEDLLDFNKLKNQLRMLKKKDLEDRLTIAITEENYEFAKIYKDELLRREEEVKNG